MDHSVQRSVVESGHHGLVTDLAVDSLGRRLASGGEDATIHIWELRDSGAMERSASLTGLEGAIVQVAWAPHRFGSMLASGSMDGFLTIWSEIAGQGQGQRQWVKSFSKQLPSTPMCVAWAPHEYGAQIACASSSGRVYMFSGSSTPAAGGGKQAVEQWDIQEFEAHATTCTSLSWAPCLPPGSLCSMPLAPQAAAAQGIPPPRLATVGGERNVKVWRYAPQDRHWVREEPVVREELATSWVEVAWAPNIGLPFTYIAAGSDEGFVAVWSQDGLDGRWRSVVLPQFSDRITRLSWSHIGTLLLVSCADQTATMWRELPNGEWEQQSSIAATKP